jgi:glutamine amidotransferase
VTIGVIDYGLGNLTSVIGAFEKLDRTSKIVSTAEEMRDCSKLVLPGVGAFGKGMANLAERNLIDPLGAFVRSGRHLLGICLGMQLLASRSFEFGEHAGLGLIAGDVRKLTAADRGLRVPHVGWNTVMKRGECTLMAGVPDQSYFYHVHSYVMHPVDAAVVRGSCIYGEEFATVVCRGNVCGTQFHPEKSQRFGLKVLENFASLDC